MYGKEIGRGSYGAVYQSLLDPSKVTKAFLVHKIEDDCIEKAYLTEVYIGHYLTSLGNPYTPKIHDFSMKQRTITMDWAGKEICQVVWPSETVMYKAIRQFILAIASLGEAGLIHRDLKPENVLWNEETERLYIIDWGLGMVSGILAKEDKSSYIQTRWWRAPEVLLYDRTKSYSSKIDVWSMGIIILDILTGQTFKGRDASEQLRLYFKVFGTPRDKHGLMSHSSFMETTLGFPLYPPTLPDLLKGVDPEIGNLLQTEILCLEPKERISSERLAKHPVIQSWMKDPIVPLSTRPFSPTWPSEASSIQPHILPIVFNWVLETCLYFKADICIFPLSCALFHRCLDADPKRRRSTLQRLASACLYLTFSFLGSPNVEVEHMVEMSNDDFTEEALLEEANNALAIVPNFIEVQRSLPISRLFQNRDAYDPPTFYLATLFLFRDCIFRLDHESVDPHIAISLACHLLNPDVHPMPGHPFLASTCSSLKLLQTMLPHCFFTKKSPSQLEFERLKGLKSDLVRDFF